MTSLDAYGCNPTPRPLADTLRESTLSRRPPTRVFTGSAGMRQPARTLRTALPRPAAPAQTTLVASQPTVDTKRRICLGKLTREVGLNPGDAVVAVIDGERVRVTHVDAPRRRGFAVGLQLDAQQRLTLTVALCHTLGIGPGHQIQAVADAVTGELTLISLDSALRRLLYADFDAGVGANENGALA